jgi:hypothetical protein
MPNRKSKTNSAWKKMDLQQENFGHRVAKAEKGHSANNHPLNQGNHQHQNMEC